jgi:hypothetical protein
LSNGRDAGTQGGVKKTRIGTAKHESHWAHHALDPLSPAGAKTDRSPAGAKTDRSPAGAKRDRKHRLRDTIAKLNKRRLLPLIRFFSDGTGKGFCWAPVEE